MVFGDQSGHSQSGTAAEPLPDNATDKLRHLLYGHKPHVYRVIYRVLEKKKQKAFVRQAIASGCLHGEEDAIQEALSLWEERERTRAEILAAVDAAEASLARGGGRTVTQESMRQLADEVKQRGRARLANEPSSSSH
jgi:Arc/MetJ-type ribon-helix-helix transcriptional regulator